MFSKRSFLLVLLAGVVIAGIAGWKPITIRYGISQARQALDGRDTATALEWLTTNVRLAPDNAETRFWLARTYRRMGRLNDTREQIERAWKLGYPVESLEREQWLTLAQSGQLQEAEKHLPDLLTAPGDDGREICEAYVTGYLLNYRLRRVFQLLDAWRRDYPEDPQPYVIQGKVYESHQNAKKAIENYQRALELDATLTTTRLSLAHLLVEVHQQQQAAQQFQLCLADDPQNVDALAGWSQCLSVMGDHKQARAILEGVLERKPEHLPARIALGALELSAGHPQRALKWLQSAADDDPWDSPLRYQLAQALQRSGRAEDAKPHFQFASDAQQARARVQILVERLEQAPEDPELRYEIGAALSEFDPQDSADWLRSAVELNPDHLRAHQGLQRHYARHGPADLAQRHREQVERLQTDSPSTETQLPATQLPATQRTQPSQPETPN